MKKRINKKIATQTGFFECLYANCKRGFIEIRSIPAEFREWLPLDDLTITSKLPEDTNIYFGVATRREGEGTKDSIVEVPAVWTDIDFMSTSQDDAVKKLERFQLKPSIVISSGNGYHVYWLLKIPAQRDNIKDVEEINKGLALHLGGDRAAFDASRILRLPGTKNMKYVPPRLVEIVTIEPGRQYDLSDFKDILPAPKAKVTDSEKKEWPNDVLKGVEEGQRNDTATRLAGRYFQKGLEFREIHSILSIWNEKNRPPLDPDELLRVIESVNKMNSKNKDGSSVQDIVNLIKKHASSANDFINRDHPDPEFMMRPWLRRGTIALIYAERGIGKTYFCLSIALAVTRKLSIGKWDIEKPSGCLYVDGELSPHRLKTMLKELTKDLSEEQAPLRVLSSSEMRREQRKTINLTNAKWRNALYEFLKENDEYKLLILDNLASLTPGIDENVKKEWDPINQWLLDLRAMNVAVIMVHHENKSGFQRGTSSREDNIDASFELKRPKHSGAIDGAVVEVLPDKNREFYGSDAEPFNFRIVTVNGGSVWQVEDYIDQTRGKIIALLDRGLEQYKIAKILKCTDSWVSQVKSEAQEYGYLDDEKQFTRAGKALYGRISIESLLKEANKMKI